MTVDAPYTIGGLAKAAGVPTSTVRYYERRGLLRPQARSDGNYRLYSREALARLRFVRSAQTAGFTLSDITLLLRFRDGEAAPCRQVQDLIRARAARVAAQMQQLQEVEGMLRRWLAACRRSERTGKCAVLEGLAAVNPGCCEKT
ncbi:MAG: heavy metal-responsive transcriptional regulator [Phycisphaerales bacterium]|nr:MAG: heavy metal-responsive transcriptional regulator [Phycisphaerales bacterium]